MLILQLSAVKKKLFLKWKCIKQFSTISTKAIILSGNDILTEGLYVFEDGTEMEWVSNWVGIDVASEDGIMFITDNNANVGSWTDNLLTIASRYICEKN